VAKASNQTASLSPKRPCQNSMTAARRQKRERWAKKPKAQADGQPAKRQHGRLAPLFDQ
jgi:hypothetical protein